jgi:hypothetical protein
MNTPCYCGCPMMQNYYRPYQPTYNNLYQRAAEEGLMNGEYIQRSPNNPNYIMTKPQVDMITDMVKKDSKNILKGIQQFITDTRLLDYLLVAVIAYICTNYNKYKDVIEQKTDELVEDLRINLPWVFDN